MVGGINSYFNVGVYSELNCVISDCVIVPLYYMVHLAQSLPVLSLLCEHKQIYS